jgi:ABC-2 type transport system permease protein
MVTVMQQSWMTLASPGVWIGAAAGVVMIVVAIRMRRWRDEG